MRNFLFIAIYTLSLVGCATNWEQNGSYFREIETNLILNENYQGTNVYINNKLRGKSPVTLALKYNQKINKLSRKVNLFQSNPAFSIFLSIISFGTYIPFALIPIDTETNLQKTNNYKENIFEIELISPIKKIKDQIILKGEKDYVFSSHKLIVDSNEGSIKNDIFKLNLVISEFKNLSKIKQYDWLKIGISESITSFLSNAKGIKIIERNNLSQILKEQQRGKEGIFSETTITKTGNITGASHLITGSYQINGDNIIINARMIATETGALLRAENVTGELGDVNEVIKGLVLRLSGAIGNALTEEERNSIARQGNDMMKKIEALSKGELSLYAGNIDAAKKYYAEALRNDKDNQSIKNILKGIDVSLKAIAVVEFKNNNNDPQYDIFSKSIPESLTSKMIHKTGLPFIERLRLDAALIEMQLSKKGVVDPKYAPKLGKVTGASQIISGSFSVENNEITIHARLMDTETGRNIIGYSKTGDIDTINEIETIISDKIIASLASVIVNNNPIDMSKPTTLADKIEKALEEGKKEASFVLSESIVSFKFAKATLTNKSFPVLKEIAGILNKHANYRIYILGHTDNIGTDESNQKLSEKRAKSVFNKFIDYGVNLNRLTMAGEGEKNPIDIANTDKAHSKNRRVELLFRK